MGAGFFYKLERKEIQMAKESETIDLNVIQSEAEKLVALLEDRKPGLATWHMSLKESLRKLHALTSKAVKHS